MLKAHGILFKLEWDFRSKAIEMFGGGGGGLGILPQLAKETSSAAD